MIEMPVIILQLQFPFLVTQIMDSGINCKTSNKATGGEEL